MVKQEELEVYQTQSKSTLRFEKNNEVIYVYNKLNDKVAELSFSSKQGIYKDAWFGFVTGDEYKEIMDGPYFSYFQQTGSNKKVCNTLGLEGGMGQETSEWFNNYFFPKMLKAGLKYNAIVIPENIFAQQTMEDFESNLGNTLARLFPNEQEAIHWLSTVN